MAAMTTSATTSAPPPLHIAVLAPEGNPALRVLPVSPPGVAPSEAFRLTVCHDAAALQAAAHADPPPRALVWVVPVRRAERCPASVASVCREC